jgi:hypothetical protein
MPPPPHSVEETGGATQLTPPPQGVAGVPGTESAEARNPLPRPEYLQQDPCGEIRCRHDCQAAAQTGAVCVCARIACAPQQASAQRER